MGGIFLGGILKHNSNSIDHISLLNRWRDIRELSFAGNSQWVPHAGAGKLDVVERARAIEFVSVLLKLSSSISLCMCVLLFHYITRLASCSCTRRMRKESPFGICCPIQNIHLLASQEL